MTRFNQVRRVFVGKPMIASTSPMFTPASLQVPSALALLNSQVPAPPHWLSTVGILHTISPLEAFPTVPCEVNLWPTANLSSQLAISGFCQCPVSTHSYPYSVAACSNCFQSPLSSYEYLRDKRPHLTNLCKVQNKRRLIYLFCLFFNGSVGKALSMQAWGLSLYPQYKL